jgi:fatty-acyl-CoA synthase
MCDLRGPNWREIGVTLKPSGDGVSVAKSWLRAIEMTTPIASNPTRIFPIVIDELARAYPDAPALLSDRETLTYRMLAERSHKYARWALGQGLASGKCVCVLMRNSPEYVAIWIGLTRVGVVVSLVNTNLTGSLLAHCINIATPSHIIVDAELLSAFEPARGLIDTSAKIWSQGSGETILFSIDRELAKHSGESLAARECPVVTIEDQALHIYTSGTSGLPKAAKISHFRIMQWSYWFAGLMNIQPIDRMYDCLPMYHSVGGVVAVASVLVKGGSVVVRDKFSATRFWSDVVNWDCTLFQYIGELCRYLVNAPPHPCEAQHRIRLCCGNGLRPDVWNLFKTRFGIPQILEFYAATEGNVSLFNLEGKPGAIGRTPPLLTLRSPTKIVKVDVETGEPVRNAGGLCICCGPNEAGEAIGKLIGGSSNIGNRFEGYNSEADSEKKVLRDAFEPGDAWFRTGDLMKRDEHGFFYFIDRIGDTFRWKGENVATMEVSEVIAAIPGIREAAVYGVPIPGYEGRVGMAALVVEGRFDLATFREQLADRLPGYARPRFLRICREIDVTATFKQRKAELVRQGYDPSASSDPMYFDDPGPRSFVRLEMNQFDLIQRGRIQL